MEKKKGLIIFKLFFYYLKQVITKWVFWIFLVPNIATLLFQYFSKRFELPQYVYVIVALVGIIWTSFQVYNETLNKIPKEKVPIPHLTVTFIDGNEYDFVFGSPYDTPDARLKIMALEHDKAQEFHYENDVLFVDGKPQYWFPKIKLVLNIRIENDGEISYDILNIKLRYQSKVFAPFLFYQDSVETNSSMVNYPLHIDPSELSLIQFISQLSPNETSTVTIAQIAATIFNLNRTLPVDLIIDALDAQGNRKEYSTSLEVSFRPLVDGFRNQCQQYKQTEFLRLMDKRKQLLDSTPVTPK